MIGPDDTTPPRGVPIGAMTVGSLEEVSTHARVRQTVDRLERTSSSQALDHAQTLAIIVSQVVPSMTADECEDIREALHEPLRRWAAEARRGLIAHLERTERQLDELQDAVRRRQQDERIWARHRELRRRLRPLAAQYPEVREALEQDR